MLRSKRDENTTLYCITLIVICAVTTSTFPVDKNESPRFNVTGKFLNITNGSYTTVQIEDEFYVNVTPIPSTSNDKQSLLALMRGKVSNFTPSGKRDVVIRLKRANSESDLQTRQAGGYYPPYQWQYDSQYDPRSTTSRPGRLPQPYQAAYGSPEYGRPQPSRPQDQYSPQGDPSSASGSRYAPRQDDWYPSSNGSTTIYQGNYPPNRYNNPSRETRPPNPQESYYPSSATPDIRYYPRQQQRQDSYYPDSRYPSSNPYSENLYPPSPTIPQDSYIPYDQYPNRDRYPHRDDYAPGYRPPSAQDNNGQYWYPSQNGSSSATTPYTTTTSSTYYPPHRYPWQDDYSPGYPPRTNSQDRYTTTSSSTWTTPPIYPPNRSPFPNDFVPQTTPRSYGYYSPNLFPSQTSTSGYRPWPNDQGYLPNRDDFRPQTTPRPDGNYPPNLFPSQTSTYGYRPWPNNQGYPPNRDDFRPQTTPRPDGYYPPNLFPSQTSTSSYRPWNNNQDYPPNRDDYRPQPTSRPDEYYPSNWPPSQTSTPGYNPWNDNRGYTPTRWPARNTTSSSPRTTVLYNGTREITLRPYGFLPPELRPNSPVPFPPDWQPPVIPGPIPPAGATDPTPPVRETVNNLVPPPPRSFIEGYSGGAKPDSNFQIQLLSGIVLFLLIK